MQLGRFRDHRSASVVSGRIVICCLQLVELLPRDLPADGSGYDEDAWIDGGFRVAAIVVGSWQTLARWSGRRIGGVGIVVGHVCVPGVADADQTTREAIGKKRRSFRESGVTFLASQSMAVVETDEMDCVDGHRTPMNTETTPKSAKRVPA